MTDEQIKQLDILIDDVSNTSHVCGDYSGSDSSEYDELFKLANDAERRLRDFVYSLVPK